MRRSTTSCLSSPTPVIRRNGPCNADVFHGKATGLPKTRCKNPPKLGLHKDYLNQNALYLTSVQRGPGSVPHWASPLYAPVLLGRLSFPVLDSSDRMGAALAGDDEGAPRKKLRPWGLKAGKWVNPGQNP